MAENETIHLVNGLFKTMAVQMIYLLDNKIIEREEMIKHFKKFSQNFSDDPYSVLWIEKVVEILEADPSRPPGEVIQLTFGQ